VGLALAYSGVRLLVAMSPTNLPRLSRSLPGCTGRWDSRSYFQCLSSVAVWIGSRTEITPGRGVGHICWSMGRTITASRNGIAREICWSSASVDGAGAACRRRPDDSHIPKPFGPWIRDLRIPSTCSSCEFPFPAHWWPSRNESRGYRTGFSIKLAAIRA